MKDEGVFTMDILGKMKNAEPVFWQNPFKISFAEINSLPITMQDIDEAEERLNRFAPFFLKVRPETAVMDGLIESDLFHAKNLEKQFVRTNEHIFLKRDDRLPIAGSIKARGGIYEVLKFAEEIAEKNGIINDKENYEQFTKALFKRLFSEYEIVVGSTGNLGLSIGMMSAILGFTVTVHMSNDAKQWKKDQLRANGVRVIEHEGDYSKAVEKGRAEANENLKAHFIDDENSKDLFVGYAVAARRLEKQLLHLGIHINDKNPMSVYLPCGVGGGPGGVVFGLKSIFGDAVRCYFIEPVQSPCMLLGMYTEKHHEISVQHIGLTNKTIADGLAVGTPSKFVGELMMPLLDGIYTVTDEQLIQYMDVFHSNESIKIEPSAASTLIGIRDSKTTNNINILWLTGGGLVPQIEWEQYFKR